MVDRLQTRGWVRREVETSDRRAVAISQTRAGRTLVPKLAAEADKNDEAFFAGLARDERENFLRTIHSLLAWNQSDGRSPVE